MERQFCVKLNANKLEGMEVPEIIKYLKTWISYINAKKKNN